MPYASKHLLRALELTTLFATAVALIVTKWFIDAGVATEGNPIAASLLATIGWYPTGIASLLTLSAVFALYRALVGEFPRITFAGALVVTGLSVLDAARNLSLIRLVDLPSPPLHFAIGLFVVAAIVSVRFDPRRVWTRSPRSLDV